MKKYEIYQLGKLPSLITIEAEEMTIDYERNRVKFAIGNENVAFSIGIILQDLRR